MTINMLMFEFREEEKKFFENNNFKDYNISFFTECLNENSVEKLPADLLENTNVISVFVNSNITQNVINKFKNLRIISTRSTAYDHICINSCEDKNIALVNVPQYGETSVAQYTMGLLIALVRNIVTADKITRKHETSNTLAGRDLQELTLGVIGTGTVGAAVCKLAGMFGLKVIAYDVKIKQELIDKYGLNYVTLDELFENSDIITLHIPYCPDNHHIINDKVLANCKQNLYLINTSRREILDLAAVYRYITNGKIKGLAMDIDTCENLSFKCKSLSDKLGNTSLECMEEAIYIDKLQNYDNVIITPHIAYATQEAIDTILAKTMTNIKDTINGDKMCRIV